MAAHTILVVDDEPASLRAVERTLRHEHRVLTSTTAADALGLLAAEPVAVIIADHRMPESSGTELLASAASLYPDTIRVLLTGYASLDTLTEAINSGHVYHYLTKPWEPHELRLVVRRGLERYEVEADRRRLMRDLQEACRRARREAEQKGRLLTLATHELGTPLHVLTNALSLAMETELPQSAQPWLATAQRSAEWLGRGLSQMATGARWRGGGFSLRRTAVDVGALLRNVQAAVAGVVGDRRLDLHFEVEDGLPTLMADPLWLERAVFNLISNAVRFTADGGTVHVRANAGEAAVDISVADTGIGIDEALIAEIFEPFSAAGGDVHLHTSGRFEFGSRGLGLGLAITKAIIEQHGGTIAVQSRRGSGSRFTLTVPADFRAVDANEIG